jgi:integral membrane protein
MTVDLFRNFRIVAFLEGCSYLLLGITMVLKYVFQMPEPNYVVGMLHGILFIIYVFLLLWVGYSGKWKLRKIFLSFIASLVPFGTFYADKYIYTK